MLVVLASTVSAHCPTYNLYRDQCYWYAGVVWAIVSDLAYPSRAPPGVGSSKKKGRNTLLPFFTVALPVDEEDKPQSLRVKYDRNWDEFCRAVEPLRGVSGFYFWICVFLPRSEQNGQASLLARIRQLDAQTELYQAQAEAYEAQTEIYEAEVRALEKELHGMRHEQR